MAKSVDDVLVGNLQYKLGEGASYVDRRESCTFFHKGPISTRQAVEIRCCVPSLILTVASKTLLRFVLTSL